MIPGTANAASRPAHVREDAELAGIAVTLPIGAWAGLMQTGLEAGPKHSGWSCPPPFKGKHAHTLEGGCPHPAPRLSMFTFDAVECLGCASDPPSGLSGQGSRRDGTEDRAVIAPRILSREMQGSAL